MLLFIQCLLLLLLFVVVLCYFITVCPSYFAILLVGKRELFFFTFIIFLMSCDSKCLWLFLTVPMVSLQCVIVVFPDHIHLLLF